MTRMKLLAFLVASVSLLGCGDDDNGIVEPEPVRNPASWRLTFVDVQVGIESIVPPLIYIEPVLQLEERNGTSYHVNYIQMEIRVLQVPDYLQVQSMGADEISRVFGSNLFQGGSTQTFEPHYSVTLFPDGDLDIVIVMSVTDELGNSKELRVRQIGDIATLRELLKALDR